MAKFTLSKQFRFEASHQLIHHDGKCQRLHGHSWRGYLTVAGHYLAGQGPKENMLMDYADIGAVAKEIEAVLDHYHLNEVLRTDMPTSEFIARWIYQTFQNRFDVNGCWLDSVTIEETCTSRCAYTERTI